MLLYYIHVGLEQLVHLLDFKRYNQPWFAWLEPCVAGSVSRTSLKQNSYQPFSVGSDLYMYVTG